MVLDNIYRNYLETQLPQKYVKDSPILLRRFLQRIIILHDGFAGRQIERIYTDSELPKLPISDPLGYSLQTMRYAG